MFDDFFIRALVAGIGVAFVQVLLDVLLFGEDYLILEIR
jgi:hypothetical protein